MTTPQDPIARSAGEAILTGGHHVVHGAPGTGKSTTAIDTFTRWLTSTGGTGVLLVPTRRRAAVVRDAVAARLQRTTSSVLVRTPASLAFAILRLRATLRGEPPPTLISGPEQDQILTELLAGHAAGDGVSIDWPASVPPEALELRAFRDELRDLHMRAAEAGLDGQGLAEWGQRHDRPEWVAAGALLAEYTQVMALGQTTPDRGARYDAASIVDEATYALRTWDRDAPDTERPRWDLVLHDDYQDATLATARLLDALADDGARLAVFGDADLAVQQFRGGLPALLHTASLPPGQDGAWGARSHVLTQVWRHGPGLREPIATLSAGLPTLQETRRRRATPTRAGSQLRTALLASEAQQVAAIARYLREQHVHHEVPWSQMAVLVRSGALAGAIRRGLRSAGVPLEMALPDRPLRDEPAVSPLLLALRCILDEQVDATDAVALLCSPVGGMDAVTVRALRRHLRQAERADGGVRHSDELVAALLTGAASGEGVPEVELPSRLARGVRAVVAVLAAGREALGEEAATVETVLWAIWSATGLSATWQRQALAGAAGADRADTDLDAVMALFRAAEQFTDRATMASPAGFLGHLEAQDFPADTLAEQGRLGDAVAVHTPAGAAGGEWDVVVVAGVQEEIWPDLRIRDSLLGAAELADIATARHVATSRGQTGAELDRFRRARREVYEGELRAFVSACSRAREQVLVTAVLNTDARPSMFFETLLPDTEEVPVVAQVPHPLDLRGLVGRLRAQVRPVLLGQEVGAEELALASEAAAVLSHLADRDVPGADPQEWPALLSPTSAEPLAEADEPVPVSPSTMELVSTCPLRWMLTRSGGQPADSAAQSLGNLIHEIAATHPHGTHAQLRAELEARWHELDLPEGWVGQVQRRRAEEMTDKLADYLAAHPGPVATEVPFEVDLGMAVLRGQVDRVELTGAGVRIVDLKTGSTAATAAETARHPQLGSYQVAADRGGFADAFGEELPTGAGDLVRSGGAALLYVGTKAKNAAQRDQRPLTEDTNPQWAEELIQDGARTMAAGRFEARPNDTCRTCPVITSCPAQPTGERVAR